MKKFKIIRDEFRNGLKGYDDMTSIVSGLTNFKVMLPEKLGANQLQLKMRLNYARGLMDSK